MPRSLPPNLNRLASSLVELLTPDQEDVSSNPHAQAGQSLGKITKSGRPSGQVFFSINYGKLSDNGQWDTIAFRALVF